MGRGFAATEGVRAVIYGTEGIGLQWGRGFATTEGSCRASSHLKILSLQWGRGFAATEGCLWRSIPICSWSGFNGAVALRPRNGGASEAVSHEGARATFESTPALSRHLPSQLITTVSVNRFIPAD